MKKILPAAAGLLLIISTQAQKLVFDIAKFTPPEGWKRTDLNGFVSFMDSKTENGATSFCQIVLYPSSNSAGTASKNFNNAWKNLVTVPLKSKAKPATQTQKTPDGWTVVTGSANISVQGLNYKCILSNITGFGKTINVQVNTAGGNYADAVDKFFNELDLDSKATPSNNNTGQNQSNMSAPVKMSDYEFIAPQGWQTRNKPDIIEIQNMESGCLINILSPQPSSGSLQQDVEAVFDMMYKGWQYQQSGERKYTLSKGFLARGLEFCMKEATMSTTHADGRYDLQEGAALVVQAGTQVVIIAVRHSGLLAHNDCIRKYDTWRRFFNSFSVKNATIPRAEGNAADRIIGAWSMLEAGATGEYVFAANGNYALIGAIGSTYTTRDFNYEYLHIKTYSFQGDGSYSISGNQLTFKRKSTNSAEQVRFRFEKINHGGTGWKDRIMMLYEKPSVGTAYEVGYEKK